MKVKNFATFGLFNVVNGKLITSGFIEELIEEAKKFCEESEEDCVISTMSFKNDKVTEGKAIISFTVINDAIYVTR